VDFFQGVSVPTCCTHGTRLLHLQSPLIARNKFFTIIMRKLAACWTKK